MAKIFRGGGANKVAVKGAPVVPTRANVGPTPPSRQSTVPPPQTNTIPVGDQAVPSPTPPGTTMQTPTTAAGGVTPPPTRAVPTKNQIQHQQASVEFRNKGRFTDSKEVDSFLNGEAGGPGQAGASDLAGISEELRGMIIPGATKPESFSSFDKYLELRDQYNANSLDEQAAELSGQIRALEDTTADRIAQEKGKSIAVGVQSGRISEIEKQQNLRARELQRGLQVINDQRNIANATISQMMGFAQTDFKNAQDLWNTEYSQNLQATQLAMTAQRDIKADEKFYLQFNEAKDERQEDLKREDTKTAADAARFEQEFGLSKERIQIKREEMSAMQSRFESGQALDKLKLTTQVGMQRAANALSAARISASEKSLAFNQMMSERNFQLKEKSQALAAMQTSFNLAESGTLGKPSTWTEEQIAVNGQLENRLGVPQGTLSNLSNSYSTDKWQTSVTDPLTGAVSAVLMGTDGVPRVVPLTDGVIPENVNQAANLYANGQSYDVVADSYGDSAANKGSALYNKQLATAMATQTEDFSKLSTTDKEKFNSDLGVLYDQEVKRSGLLDPSAFFPGAIGENLSNLLSGRITPGAIAEGPAPLPTTSPGASESEKHGYSEDEWAGLPEDFKSFLITGK